MSVARKATSRPTTRPASKAAAKSTTTTKTKAPAKSAKKSVKTTANRQTTTAPTTAPKAATPPRKVLARPATKTTGANFVPPTPVIAPAIAPAATMPVAPLASAAPKTHTRENSAQARVIAMLKAPEGATLDAIMKATNWQAHTVRGFISGTAKKKLGLAVESTRVDGQRVYRIAA